MAADEISNFEKPRGSVSSQRTGFVFIVALSTLGTMLLFPGCASAPAKQQETVATTTTTTQTTGTSVPERKCGMKEDLCPMMIPGTQISVEDTPNGVSLLFTTTGSVAELQHRVHHMAGLHKDGCPEMKSEESEISAQGGGGMMGSEGMDTSHSTGMSRVPVTASVMDLPRGARLELTPKDPSQLVQLRTNVRTHVEHLSQGKCSRMMEGK